MSMNQCCFVGRLGKDIELKQTQGGISYAKFSLAVDRSYKSGEERITDWIDFTAWRGTAEFASKWFHKGDVMGVVGSLQVRKWVDNDGQNRRSSEIAVREIMFVTGKREAGEDAAPAPAQPVQAAAAEPPMIPSDDDLPF